ncbi:unnamed protein product [Phaedon cochleariae]|uniref:PX domain-containing protein n=1 Tax=Phaedon cochleariae TaxID=80249 RepID=A0A9P0DS70_PHACE|nr:unnamed protein product [Phaedon cochleariae]
MTQIMSNNKQGLNFEVISAKISDDDEKKYVIYTLQIRFIAGVDDANPSIIQRRYTHFLDLYNGLKKEHPNLMTNISFPNKALFGNFDNDLITTRSTEFESLMKYIGSESQLKNSNSLRNFLQDIELKVAMELLQAKDYPLAYPLLENILKLLNKVYTDRSPAVIVGLVRLLACAIAIPGMPDALKWADLAIHRFEGISDSDLLELYVPLLQTCIKLWRTNGRSTESMEQSILNFQKQGVKIEGVSLLQSVQNVEEKILKSP